MASLLLKVPDHGAQVPRSIQVVVVEVGNELAGGQVCSQVSLGTDAPVAATRSVVLHVGDAGISLGLLHEEVGVTVCIGLNDDQLLVRPCLRLEAPPDLLVELVPRVSRRGDARHAPLLPCGTLRPTGHRRGGNRRRLVFTSRPPGVHEAVCPKPQGTLAVVPLKCLRRQRRHLPLHQLGPGLVLARLQNLADLDHEVIRVEASAPPAAHFARRVHAPANWHEARARASIAVQPWLAQGVQVLQVLLASLRAQGGRGDPCAADVRLSLALPYHAD
mmetsp:Transcript_65624/g.186175  ORF Transcript_65624/g.186175 Transcript_65624/m.186175 type:complete len:275 (-) Transcript_65624:387-1211(-)